MELTFKRITLEQAIKNLLKNKSVYLLVDNKGSLKLNITNNNKGKKELYLRNESGQVLLEEVKDSIIEVNKTTPFKNPFV